MNIHVKTNIKKAGTPAKSPARKSINISGADMTNIIGGLIPLDNSQSSVFRSYSVIDELESLGLIESPIESRMTRARSRLVELGMFDKSTGEIILNPILLHSGYIISFQGLGNE